MSIDRTSSTRDTEAAESSREARNDTRQAPRDPPPRENVDRFRQLMQQRGTPSGKDDSLADARRPTTQAAAAKDPDAEHAAVQAVGARGDASDDANRDALLRRKRDEQGLSSHALQAADASAMFQAQQALRAETPPQVPAPMSASAFADLIERHVRQLAIGGGERGGDGQVLLRMADATLPGTDLLLSRTVDGWMLRADVRSRSSYDAIKDAAPELAKRFAERNLGELSFDPHFHG